jgi:integrase
MSQTERLDQGIRKLPSGKYQIRYMGLDGKRHSGGTYRQKRDAVRALSRILASMEAGTWKPLARAQEGGPDPRKITLREYSEKWLGTRLTKQGKPLAPKTQELYRYLLDRPLAEFADTPIRRITLGQVQDWWARAEFGEGRTRNASYKYLKALLDHAAKNRLIPASPCTIENATEHKPKETIAPTETELAIMMESTSSDDLRAVMALMAFCGLRPSEALALRRKSLSTVEQGEETWWAVTIAESLSWLKKPARVVFKEPKSNKGVRCLQIPHVAVPYILKHLESVSNDPEALLFSRDSEGRIPWAESRLKQRLEPLRKVAGYKGSAYGFRHYHLTRYHQAGASIREVMERGGHSTIEAAMRYQHTTGREHELLKRMGS